MQIEKIHHNVEFTAPEIKNFANVHPVVEDATSRELRRSPQLQELLASKNDTILEIRKISDNEYHIITNGGHIIPIEILYAPYPYAYRFSSLSWDRGVYKKFDG
jgi:hypothetical protein